MLQPFATLRRAAVYNLTVEDAHEYYANGMRVSNCDALRYLLAVRPIGARPPKSKVGLDVNERFAKLVGSLGKRPKGRLFT